ncbi:hypothetical protein [Allosphingosinicella deserti]|uniref:hypothetical protein n=1 Tax=Allosphingosinicella deserti TaxID=2116704 RepID=UPI001304C796|nr:hypothetical protein [Sphingomonas deserti]
MKILFYLPVVTPWWFDNIVVNLIGKLSTAAEVHVLVPPLWRNTGVGADQLRRCAHLQNVHWHLVDGESHHSLRTVPEDPDGLVEFVRSIGPDVVLCRSADTVTPARFPGAVYHLMEAGAPPFSTPVDSIILQSDFWHHGAMPPLGEADRHAIRKAFADTWRRARYGFQRQPSFRMPRAKALEQMGLPADRKVLAVPLEYEHEEAFTAHHNRFTRNIDLLRYLTEQIDEKFVLAITDHPLNYKYVDNAELYEAIAAMGDRAVIIRNPEMTGAATDLLVKHCDGLVVQNTKSIYAGAFFGKPVLRLSHRHTAASLGVYEDIAPFLAELDSGVARAAPDCAAEWFGFHLLHEVFDPLEISAAELLDRLQRRFSVDRLRGGLERLAAYDRELELAGAA